jgi:RNA polymerase sigma factor (sigma-70 family)
MVTKIVQKEIELEEKLFLEFRDNNDEVSFEKLFRITEPWLFKLIIKIVGDRDTAKDILQNVWVQVIEKMNEFNPSRGKFVNYLFTVAKNFALMWYKKDLIHRTHNNKLIANMDVSNPYEEYSLKETGDFLFKIIKSLKNENHQNAILLFYYSDLELKDIARKLNTNEQNIKNWLMRAKIKIEDEINKDSELLRNFESYLIF